MVVREVQSNLQVQSSLASLPVLPFRQAGAVKMDKEVTTNSRTLHTLNVGKHFMKASHYIWILMIVLIMSCSRKSNKESIKEFVLYGYSGFVFSDFSKYTFDSTKLQIRQYFEYEKDSSLKIFKGKSDYTRILPSNITGFKDTLNTFLISNSFHREYLPGKLSMYDGCYYTIYYVTTTQKEVLISYIPDELPDSLRILHDYILNIIRTESKIDKAFEFNRIIKIDALNLFKKYPPPPPPSGKIKFHSPRIINDDK
jgi:hypothetical protein